MIIAVITGTRRDTRKGEVTAWLDEVRPDVLIVGDCPTGVDREALYWGMRAEKVAPTFEGEAVGVIRIFADWSRGKGAGPDRNERMASRAAIMQRHYPSARFRCAAFPDETSRGTWDCVRRLKRHGFGVEIR